MARIAQWPSVTLQNKAGKPITIGVNLYAITRVIPYREVGRGNPIDRCKVIFGATDDYELIALNFDTVMNDWLSTEDV